MSEELRRRFGEFSEDALAKIDLKQYLRDTASFEVEPGERLRLLAIAIETQATWPVIRRIYDRARELSPESVAIEHSTSIAAAFFERWDVALAAITRALELDPANPDLHTQLGMVQYSRREKDAALAAFDRAIELGPRDSWAQLYRAHCLHDREDWAGALAAYRAVDLAPFTGPRTWRADVLREQMAHCRLMTGDREGALAEFRRILDRYERELHLAHWAMSVSLWAAAEGELREELYARVLAIDVLASNLDP